MPKVTFGWKLGFTRKSSFEPPRTINIPQGILMVKMLKIIKNHEFHQIYGFFIKTHNFSKMAHLLVGSAFLREKQFPEPLIFHKEYLCFQGRGAKVCFWLPKTWNLANLKEIW